MGGMGGGVLQECARGYAWQGACIIFLHFITVPNSSCGKVMFSQDCVKNYVHRGGAVCGRHGGVCGKGPAWQKGV